MKILFVFASLFLSCRVQAVLVPPEPARIRVRLAEAMPLARIEGFDLKISSGGKGAAPQRISQWEFRCQKDRVRAVQLRGTEALDLPSPVIITSPAVFLQYQGHPYREELRVLARGSVCEVVNVLDIEKYLDGLVNSEFSSRWNDEAVEAQVVAARSYAVYQMRRSKALDYDVEATVKDQVYDGSMKEDPRSARLVAKTRGLVLAAQALGEGMVPLKAFYHSTCAGKTALPQTVWGASYPGFRRTVICPFCASSPAIHWELDLSSQMLEERFRLGAFAETGNFQMRKWPKNWRRVIERGRLIEMHIQRWDDQGRVAELISEWEGVSGGPRIRLVVPGARFRDWMGAWRFRSAAFNFSSKIGEGGSGTFWHFSGRGYGHGVGMCQYGAKVMGERGYRMAGILKHYYPDAILRKLW